jgi:hypothetical protein
MPNTEGLPGQKPMYQRHAAASDRGRWSVERDIAWDSIDKELAHARPEVLEQMRSAALIESYHPVNLARLMLATRRDVDAGVCLSLEAFEGFKHFHALRLYLEAVDYSPAITDADLVSIRESVPVDAIPEGHVLEHLVEFMLSEHLASYFFRRLSAQAAEPVLQGLLRMIAADEVRHAQSASDLIAKRIADPEAKRRVLQAAVDFRHYGADAVPDVPVAMHGDAVAISTFSRRIERLCGTRLVDYLKEHL